MKTVRNNNGFTLLELMVSLILVVLIVATSLVGIRLGITSQEITEKRNESYQRLRFIRERLTTNIRSLYPHFYKANTSEAFNSIDEKEDGQAVLAFEGKPDSIKFVTYAEKLNSFKSNPLFHEVRFLLGTHPKSGEAGLIMIERDVSYADAFKESDNPSDKESYVMLAKDVAYLKFRYYQIERINLTESTTEGESIVKNQGEWVDQAANRQNGLADPESEKDQETLESGKNIKTSLPRAIEVSVGILEGGVDEPKLALLPPMVITLNSGMVFERTFTNDNKTF